MVKDNWIICPLCYKKTRTKIRPDTEAKRLPVLCRMCKSEFIMDIEGGEVTNSKINKDEPDT